MHLPIVTLFIYYFATVRPARVFRQIKDFAVDYNHFLQSDYKIIDPSSSPEETNRINILYKTVEEPIPIEKTVPVPVVKHIPQPVPVYVPHPYPVERKVFVPYKIYEKQPVPIIHRYPVEKSIHVPVHVPVEQPIAVLVPYHVPIRKNVPTNEPIISSSNSKLREILHPINGPIALSKSKRIKFPVEKSVFKTDDASSEVEASSSLLRSTPHAVEKIIPFGTRITIPNSVQDVAGKSNSSNIVSAEDSTRIEIITPSPIEIDNTDSYKETPVQENANVKHELAALTDEQKDAENKEENNTIVFPNERNDIKDKS